MNKTQAAEIIARDVRVWARNANVQITKRLVEERISELRGPNYQGNLKGDAANIANVVTTLRQAARDAL